MKFAANHYNIDFHVNADDKPPLSGAKLEQHPFGLPPFEMRSIWIVEVADLPELLKQIEGLGASLEISQSGYWSGDSCKEPGDRMFGISVMDDPDFQIDPRDQPVRLRKGQ